MFNVSRYKIRDAILMEPSLEDVLKQVARGPNLYYSTSGYMFPKLLGSAFREFPVLVVGSRRIPANWPEIIITPRAHLSVDACEVIRPPAIYLTWSSKEFSLAIDAFNIDEELELAAGCGSGIVIWVTDADVILDFFKVSDVLLDTIDAGARASSIARYVPDDQYVEGVMSSFSPAFVGEDRFIGLDGKPVYVVQEAP